MIKILMADDQIILRESLKFIIEQDSEVKVVATAKNGREAYELCAKFIPDVVLMDINMPEFDGIYGTSMIKKDFPKIKVLVLTTFDNDENIMEALNNGADGYILKDVNPTELIMSIKNIYAGLAVVQKDVLNKMMTMKNSKQQTMKTDINITERELSIIRLIVDGKSNKEIASQLFISEGTVKNIVTIILEKLKLRDRTQLAVYVLKSGIV